MRGAVAEPLASHGLRLLATPKHSPCKACDAQWWQSGLLGCKDDAERRMQNGLERSPVSGD